MSHYTLFNLRDRQLLQGENDGEHYDSLIMAKRGFDFAAKLKELEDSEDHTVEVYVPPEPDPVP